jgi:hypothetical protein
MWGDDPPTPPDGYPSLAFVKPGLQVAAPAVGVVPRMCRWQRACRTRQSALTAARSLLIVSFASPKSRVVVGS